MLVAIKTSLIESANMSDVPKDKSSERWKQIEQFLEHHDVIQNVDVRKLCGVSAATAITSVVKDRKVSGDEKSRTRDGDDAAISA